MIISKWRQLMSFRMLTYRTYCLWQRKLLSNANRNPWNAELCASPNSNLTIKPCWSKGIQEKIDVSIIGSVRCGWRNASLGITVRHYSAASWCQTVTLITDFSIRTSQCHGRYSYPLHTSSLLGHLFTDLSTDSLIHFIHSLLIIYSLTDSLIVWMFLHLI